MKRVGLWMIGIGLFITVGLITVKQGYAEEEEHAPTCTKATLKGRYLFAADSTHLPPLTPNIQARAGYRIFHGDGTGITISTEAYPIVKTKKSDN